MCHNIIPSTYFIFINKSNTEQVNYKHTWNNTFTILIAVSSRNLITFLYTEEQKFDNQEWAPPF